MRPTTSAAASTVRALITSVPETSLRELFIEWALAALRYLVVSPGSEPTAPTSADRARRHWTKARREAHNGQQRERRRLARADNPNRRGRKGTPSGSNGSVSPEALWQHAAKLEPKAPWRAVVRELGVSESLAQNAERDGTFPNITPAAARRFLAL